MGTAVGGLELVGILTTANIFTLSVFDLSLGEVGNKAKVSSCNAITSGLSTISPKSASYFSRACNQWNGGTFVGIAV